jgi:PEP-CTERM motif
MKLFGLQVRAALCRLSVACLFTSAEVLSGSVCRADFVLDLNVNGILWNRPTATGGPATFQAWETFSSVSGPNAPQTVQGVGTGVGSIVSTGVANALLGFGGSAGAVWSTVNSAGVPNAFNSDPAAMANSFLTSGGNIYSPSAIVSPRITIPNNIDNTAGNQIDGVTNFVLQVRTIGLPDLNSFRLTDPTNGSLLAPVSPIVQLGTLSFNNGFGTSTYYDHLVRFQASGNADLYQIDFTSAGTSLSLDRIAVDTFFSPASIPEPSSLFLIGIGMLVSLRRRRFLEG